MWYSFSESVKNAWSLLMTRIFYRPARLIRRPVYIRGKKGMRYGKGFTTGYSCRFEVFNAEDGIKLEIGDRCRVGDRVHLVASEQVVIGNDCLMASNIFISDTNHGSLNENPNIPPNERLLTAKPVYIGDNVWIGEGVCILPGAAVGDGCVLGAHSVVSGNIPPFSIAAGVPARVIKVYDADMKKWKRC